MTIECPKCKHPVLIDISRAVDEEGESFMCDYCGWIIRYTSR